MQLKISLFFLLFSVNLNAEIYSTEDKVIYGADDRKDVFESRNALYKKLANSTAAMIQDSFLVAQDNEMVWIQSNTLEQDGICSEARFAKQTTAANCSGFLVGSQLLVTAGHCIQEMDDCEKYSWVFGYANIDEEKIIQTIPKNNIYKCTKIISRVLDRSTANDFALVKLERAVIGHEPLKFRVKGKISHRSNLVVIGHPSGLPVKIADSASVRSNSNKYFFQANLDTFGGNSGSAVFDSKTGVVEGILVRGETDYVNDPIKNCYLPKVCKISGCRGEDVTRITNIKELIN